MPPWHLRGVMTELFLASCYSKLFPRMENKGCVATVILVTEYFSFVFSFLSYEPDG